jgi:hypothetical protein
MLDPWQLVRASDHPGLGKPVFAHSLACPIYYPPPVLRLSRRHLSVFFQEAHSKNLIRLIIKVKYYVSVTLRRFENF